nr:xylulose kinase-1 [Tanacetum cinerariifolium]
MALTFADIRNMIAYLTKSDASEGFDQIIDFLKASAIQYALTINPNIYVSCIKQFWSSVLVKKVNDVIRLQALIDRKKMIITEATVREALRLDDAESIDCLPNKEIFTELSRMGVETPLFEGMLVPQQAAVDVDNDTTDDVLAADTEPTPPSPPPTATPPPPQELPSTSKGEIIANIDADEDVTLKDVAAVAKEVENDEPKPADLQEVIEVVTTTNLMIEVVTAATTPITAATITVAPSADRRRKGVVIRDPEETVTPQPSYILSLNPKIKEKGLCIEEEAIDRSPSQKEYDGLSEEYDVAFLEKSKEELEEEESIALKRKTESSEEKAAKKEDLEMLWQIVKERFASSKPKNFSDDFLLTTLTYMFKKPDVEAQVGKNQRGIHGLAKVKS